MYLEKVYKYAFTCLHSKKFSNEFEVKLTGIEMHIFKKQFDTFDMWKCL